MSNCSLKYCYSDCIHMDPVKLVIWSFSVSLELNILTICACVHVCKVVCWHVCINRL